MVQIKRSNPKAFDQLRARIAELDKVSAQAGWFASSKYESGVPMAYVATIQEFGYGKIPARPFMRRTVTARTPFWRDAAGKGAKAILAGKTTARTVMGLLAADAVGEVQKTIAGIYSPALSPITIELRHMRKAGESITGKSVGIAARAVQEPGYQTPTDVTNKPLIDDSYNHMHMAQAMTYAIEEK